MPTEPVPDSGRVRRFPVRHTARSRSHVSSRRRRKSGSRWPSSGRARACGRLRIGVGRARAHENPVGLTDIEPAGNGSRLPGDLATIPSRMSASETRHSSKSKWRMMATSRISSRPTMTSTRSCSSPGLYGRSARGRGGQSAERRPRTASRVEDEWWMRCRRRRAGSISASIIGRCHGAGQADQPDGVVDGGQLPGARRRGSRAPPRGPAESSRVEGGSCVQEALGEADAADVEGNHAWARAASGPGPTANSVEPPPMSTTSDGPSAGSSSAVAPAKDRRPSSSPSSSSGRTPIDGLGRGEEVLAVAGVTRRRRGDHPDPPDAEAVHDLAVLAAGPPPCARWLRGQPLVLVDSLAQPGDPHAADRGCVRPGRRPAGGWSWSRSRWPPPARSRPHPQVGEPADASRSPTQRPTGSSPPARYQA